MKKLVSVLLICLLCAISCIPATAAQDGPVITFQPQNTIYTIEDADASYTVKAEGKNLSATWYMQWQGTTYTISDVGGSMQAWEPYAGENYGPQPTEDSNTFTYSFMGIGPELNGAYIWCVIEDGHYDVASQRALISVVEGGDPPRIVDIPPQLTVEKGEEAEIRCVAQAPGETQLSFLWYETDTGMLQDIRAVNRGEETADYLLCDTSVPGTRNYVCMVTTTQGGVAYSSIVPVTVIENAVPPEETTGAPDATEPVETKPVETEPDVPPETADDISAVATTPTTQPQATPQSPAATAEATANSTPWWIFAAVGVVAAGAGVGAAFLLVKKKK